MNTPWSIHTRLDTNELNALMAHHLWKTSGASLPEDKIRYAVRKSISVKN